MKATELRRGNYVKTFIHGIGIVEAISGTDVLYSKNYDSIKIEEFHPVELSEEMLLNLGFKEDDSILKLKVTSFGTIAIVIRKDGSVFCEINQDRGYTIGSVKCDYLHELQNLFFALTGKELASDSAQL